MRHLVGPRLSSLQSSTSYLPFLHLLPALENLKLNTSAASAAEEHITILDLGPLAAVATLRELTIEGGHYHFEYLDQLTQLHALELIDLGPPADETISRLGLPTSLTRLVLESCDWDFAGALGPMPAWARPSLQVFQGRLLSLTLDPPFVGIFDDAPSQLSGLAGLQQLTHLKLGCVMGMSVDGRFALSSLQSLQLETFDWPAGQHPSWDLTSCPSLTSISLVYREWEHGHDSMRVLDLRGITGCLAATLDLELQVKSDMRAIASFSAWVLKGVHISAFCPLRNWRMVQSVHDLIGALAGHLLIPNVVVNNERLG